MPLKDAQSGAIRTLKKCGSAAPVSRSIQDIARLEGVLSSLLPVQLTQLAGGQLRSELLALDLGALQVLRLRFDRPLHGGGPKPKGRQLIALDLEENPGQSVMRSHGLELPATAFFGLAAGGEIHLTTPERCSLALLSLDRERFLQWACELGAPGLEEPLEGVNWQAIDPRRFERVKACLRRIFRLAVRSPALMEDPTTRRRLCGDLVPLLVEALVHRSGHGGRLARPPARIELVKAAQAWMAEHPHEPISLDGLCRQVVAGRRSLLQGFQEHLGMGPMAYLKIRRLHGVRQALLRADPQATTISQLAAQWGFMNAGHFARDYRALFGEPPSTSLRAEGANR
ncbi:helix-turn-helix domain-containing protein [Cyanobium sp. Cruz CV13-4-11]|jgi:AraC family transcriptional regulator, ethanolamine operon transcriptional activator|nr:helix-turn-helix domain-containing protein [Cyanobium sp. Cruz CV11-17]MCP9920443.1 helix-turn-helix domain-containing protein [Cyanobium sp. Cruz CV13-4-11]